MTVKNLEEEGMPDNFGDILKSLYGSNDVATVFSEMFTIAGKLAPFPDECVIGKNYEGHGIFAGPYFPNLEKNDDGEWEYHRDEDSFIHGYNLFVAPNNLPGEASYKETMKKIESLTDYFGHAGTTSLPGGIGFLPMLRKKENLGKWFLPVDDMLLPCDSAKGQKEFPLGNIYSNRDKGMLRNLFTFAAAKYWILPDNVLSNIACEVHYSVASGLISGAEEEVVAGARLVRAEAIKR